MITTRVYDTGRCWHGRRVCPDRDSYLSEHRHLKATTNQQSLVQTTGIQNTSILARFMFGPNTMFSIHRIEVHRYLGMPFWHYTLDNLLGGTEVKQFSRERSIDAAIAFTIHVFFCFKAASRYKKRIKYGKQQILTAK